MFTESRGLASSSAVIGGLALCLILVGFSSSALADPGQRQSDDAFIRSLGDPRDGKPLDRKRLARLFFSVASTLDGGRSSVRLLQSSVAAGELSSSSVRNLLASGYDAYVSAVDRFKDGVSDLLDDPDSASYFYRVLSDGHRSCWRFDRHVRVVETYGGVAADLMTIVSSREACSRFRQAALAPRVEDLIASALAEWESEQEEVRQLRVELRELEQLIEELREIDSRE